MSMPITEAIIGRESELQRLRDCVQLGVRSRTELARRLPTE